YPNGQAGCTGDAGGHWTCAGTCALGKRTCTAGQLGECIGARMPAATETCTAVGMAAADENCNGMVDENCACMNGEMRSCYTGPEGTLNVGKCAAGMQVCTNGALGMCQNSVVPGIETCNNVDDDCNGKVDDKVDTQTDVMNCGACGKACATGEGCCAGKCVDTTKDANNCGMCGAKCTAGSKCDAGKCVADIPPPMPGTCMPACAAGQTCCGGTCVDTKTDAKNCGMCGMACSAGMQPGCCAGKCIDLVSDTNCGECGKDCSLLSTSSITCTCTRDTSNKIACTGPVLNLCL
ncbi:MAG TPA: MopE-related protein, partial [Polyangiales bacterium]|nr:MopE-related protein [Polyangiales bacterium]